MIDRYVSTIILQARERAKILKSKIPSPMKSPEMQGLQRTCEDQIDRIIEVFDYLGQDPAINHPDMLAAKLRQFRKTYNDLCMLESTGIAALNRLGEDDVFFSKLVFELHIEINFPLAPPTVSCLSRYYYRIFTGLKMMEVPLAESEFLLHLPDLLHEMGHLLVAAQDQPKVEAFQKEMGKLYGVVLANLREQQRANARSTGPKEYIGWILKNLENSWTRYWIEELFCDLFALYVLGPSFAWAHFHLTAERGGDPFEIMDKGMMSHPPDNARMEALLAGLKLIGYTEDNAKIENAWNNLIHRMGYRPDSFYQISCPKEVIEQAAVHALTGTKAIGCNIASQSTTSNIRDLLNEAWCTFWRDPDRYSQWEREQIEGLKDNC